jgi:hypothetical protein
MLPYKHTVTRYYIDALIFCAFFTEKSNLLCFRQTMGLKPSAEQRLFWLARLTQLLSPGDFTCDEYDAEILWSNILQREYHGLQH